jgi:two-component system LytT family response regulator
MKMDTFNVIIAGDMETTQRPLRDMLQFHSKIAVIGEALTIEELVDHMHSKEPHIILMDVGDPQFNGMEAVKVCMAISPDVKLIMLADDARYAVEAFDLCAMDYIVKPFHSARLRASLEKAFKAMTVTIPSSMPSRITGDTSKKFIIRTENTIHFIPLQEIIFIEKVDRKSLIHTTTKIIEVTETLSSIASHLNFPFVPTHRSYIVNYHHISNIVHNGDTYLVYFDKYNKHAYISKNKLPQVMDQFVEINTLSEIV